MKKIILQVTWNGTRDHLETFNPDYLTVAGELILLNKSVAYRNSRSRPVSEIKSHWIEKISPDIALFLSPYRYRCSLCGELWKRKPGKDDPCEAAEAAEDHQGYEVYRKKKRSKGII